MVKLPPSPWHTVKIDFLAIFPSQDYLLVVIDAYSCFLEIKIVIFAPAAATLLKLQRIFSTHGKPEVIKTDNGLPFPGKDFYHIMKELGLQRNPSTPLWPHGNTEAESFIFISHMNSRCRRKELEKSCPQVFAKLSCYSSFNDWKIPCRTSISL